MDAVDLAGLLALGFVAGVAGGVVGAGAVSCSCRPRCCSPSCPRLGAEATSLVVIVPVSFVGTWRQRRYGHVCLRDGLLVGALSRSAYWWVCARQRSAERALELSFAAVQLLFAWQLAKKAGLR